MGTDIRDSDINTLRILAMKVLKQETQNDETVGINRHSIFERACVNAGASGGQGQYDSKNMKLENLVFQDLVGRGHVTHGERPDQIYITYQGKNASDYR
jgi:hypothetical protein